MLTYCCGWQTSYKQLKEQSLRFADGFTRVAGLKKKDVILIL